MRKLKQVGRYSGRHRGEGEKDQCPRFTYKRHEAGQKCPAEERSCNTCGEKKKTARRVQEEQRDTSSESSDTEGEQEVNRVIRKRAWPGTSSRGPRSGRTSSGRRHCSSW